ncbi:phage late control D family protein [Serratia marcescens]|uniref:phage late control D family protein n=1 Tax=Serratia marcescens TaxID=615 RepID=UPI0024C48110|nr:phage late control D family protein [Serratia marcescens]MDK1706998.1 phage late control D family protein [Serratia marcescens]
MNGVNDILSSYSPRPAFDIQVAGQTVLPVNDRLISLTVTENRGFTADTIEIELDDTDGKLQLPRRGTQIAVAIGWQGEPLVKKGLFTVDEITHQGPPDRLVITARSADFRNDFNVKREYSWHNCTVSYVVSAIAGRYNLTPGISTELANLVIDHADQTQESDISFLTRMADMLNAATTIKNGMLLFFTPGAGRSASGRVLPSITLTRQSGDSHNFRVADRDAYTGVEAYWLDLSFGKKRKTRVTGRRKARQKSSSQQGHYLDGDEGNVYVMRATFKTELAAKRAAIAKWQQLKRGAAEFSMTLARGRAELYPELHANMQGFKTDIDNGDWTITRTQHTISGRGFITALEFEVRLTDWTVESTTE